MNRNHSKCSDEEEKKKLNEFFSRGYYSNCIKVEFVRDLSAFTYSFLCSCHNTALDENQIGIGPVYAQSIGLKEGDEVLISTENAMSLACVRVVPQNRRDYTLITKYFDHLENVILNQVKIVAIGQTIPIHFLRNVTINLKVESLRPEAQFGELQQCTELVVVDPSEIPEIDFVTPRNLTEPVAEEKTGEVDFFDIISRRVQISAKVESDVSEMGDQPQETSLFLTKLKGIFMRLWKGGDPQESAGDEKDHLPKICRVEDDSVYRVNTALFTDHEFPKSVREKCIIVKRLPVPKTVDGPCCFKIFCKILKVEENPEGFVFDSKVDYSTFAYVVKLSDFEDESSKDIYCPAHLLRILNLRIGSYLNIEEVKREKDYMDENRTNALTRATVKHINYDIFPKEMKNIFDITIKTVINNMIFKENVNTLIVGGTGTGKSCLLDSLMSHIQEKSLFCRKIEGKKLRKMKVQPLTKLFSASLSECCNFPPSILFIDDLDALLIADEDDSQYKLLYSERVGNLLTNLVFSYQKLNDLTVIATVKSLPKLKCMSTDRGPTIFHNIHEIDHLDSAGRNHVLAELLSEKYPKNTHSFIEHVASKTKGYTIQDLYDLIELAAFKSLSRNKYERSVLEKIDLDLALSEKVPLSLYGVNLNKNSRTNWDDIGGLEEPKKLLKEIFEWPIKYRELYQSCPLRLQCGVLLYGPPGTGKTLLASAVANECGLNFISVKGPEIFSKYVGASEQGIRDLFQRAKKARPCLLFFDEFDSLAPRRGNSNEDVNDRVVNQILTELDGVEELKEVFVLAATSRPDLLDPALLRPGRIDRTIHFDLPGEEDRVSILKALSKSLPLSDDVNFEEIASKTSGFTGADLQAVLYAAQTAFVKEVDKNDGAENRVVKIKRSHLLAGLAQTKPSISKMDHFKYQSIYENFISSRMGAVSENSRQPVQQIMFA